MQIRYYRIVLWRMIMTIYDILNHFYTESSKNTNKMDVITIASNYEYYSNLISAYLFSYNNPVEVERYYQTPTPTFGTSSSRLDYALQSDRMKIFSTYINPKDNYFFSVKRLYSEINCFRFDSSRDFSNIINESFITSVKSLIKFVVYIRNQYIHENQKVLDYLVPFLDNVYKCIIETTHQLVLSTSTEFIVIESNEIYCLNTVNPKHIYKNIYSRSVELKNYPITMVHHKQSVENNQKEIVLNNITFIPFHGGTISYIPSGFKKTVEDYIEPFAISKYPISNKEYLEFLEYEFDYYHKRSLEPLFLKDYRSFNQKQKEAVKNSAVYFVSWLDAVKYCNYLSKKTSRDIAYKKDMTSIDNHGIRLPTEGEWIFAATCGQGTQYEIPQNIISRENRVKNKVAQNIDLYENSCGVCGMLGNINEWTNTDAVIIQFKKFETSDTNYNNRKIIKGGSFATQRRIINYNYATDVSMNNLHFIGFRVLIKL